MQVFIWEATAPHWRAGGKRGREGSQGRRTASLSPRCRLWLPGALLRREPGKQSGACAPSKPRPRAPPALLPLGLVKGQLLGGETPLHPRSSTQRRSWHSGLELCELISRGWRAQAVSVRGVGEVSAPFKEQRTQGTPSTLQCDGSLCWGLSPSEPLPSSPRPSHPERVKAF